MGSIKTVLAWLLMGCMVAYPFLIYWSLGHLEPRILALMIGLLLIGRVIYLRRGPLGMSKSFGPLIVAFGIIVILELFLNDGRFFLFIPSLISLTLFVAFGATLFRPPTMVERFARMYAQTLSAPEIRYCRNITLIWCAFFVVNILISLFSALQDNLSIWTIYNGLVSYVIMGCLFLFEMVYRYWRFRRYVGAPTDIFFQRIFPPLSPGKEKA